MRMFRHNRPLFIILMICSCLFVITSIILFYNLVANGLIISISVMIPALSIIVLSVFSVCLLLLYFNKKQKSLYRKLNSFLSEYLGEDVNESSEKDPELLIQKVASLGRLYIDLQNELMNRDVFRQGFFNTMINGLVVHKRMEILDVNRALCEITGFTEEEILKHTLEKVFIPHESLTGEIADDHSRLYYRSMCFSKNGQKFPVDIQMSCIQLENRKVQISIIRDLREKRDIEEQLLSERARRMKAMFDGQEMERRRLAKEIHDGLGQSLIAIRLLIEGKIAVSSEVDKDALEKIRSLIDRTIDDARLMSNNLMPSVLHEFGFVTALRQMCDHVRQTTKIRVNFQVECSKFMLSTVQTVYLFRIAQEAINNILKHADASEMTVMIDQTESLLNFKISDNGKGIPQDRLKQADGNGLFNIKERVQLLKGEFEISSESGKGTEIIIVIPNWRLVTNE
jgi:PAS domain S-box-containing protein